MAFNLNDQILCINVEISNFDLNLINRKIQLINYKEKRMKKAVVSILFVVSVVALLSTSVFADPSIKIMGGGGLNMCMEDGNAKCTDVGSSLGFFIAPEVKLSEVLSVGLDINYGMFSLDNDESGDASMSSLQIMPIVRGYYEIAPEIEVFGGLGLGYTSYIMSYKMLGQEGTSNWSTLLGAKLNFGGSFKLSEELAAGVMLDYVMNSGGETCVDAGGSETCSDDDDNDVPENAHLNFYIKYSL